MEAAWHRNEDRLRSNFCCSSSGMSSAKTCVGGKVGCGVGLTDGPLGLRLLFDKAARSEADAAAAAAHAAVHAGEKEEAEARVRRIETVNQRLIRELQDREHAARLGELPTWR
eukprot:1187032-Prorocentrum_minimum.AAC.3